MLITAFRVGIGGVFVFASVGKISGRRSFEDALAQYGLSADLAHLISKALPPVELLMAICLLAGLLMPFPAIGCSILLLAFAAMTFAQVRKGKAVPCACFGTATATLVTERHAVTDLALALAAALSSGLPNALEWSWPVALLPKGLSVSAEAGAFGLAVAAAIYLVGTLVRAVATLHPSREQSAEQGRRMSAVNRMQE
ncbi:MAG: hypothetical protein M3P18_12725 [Actinomycetota bacterium]|nr:hypothetical protein [Actinomycetota bacterium]